jgi:arylsulfatase
MYFMLRNLINAALIVIGAIGLAAGAGAQERFGGKIGPSYKDSQQWWPTPVAMPAGAPNIVVVLLDDAGFASLGSYGAPINTPRLDRLAYDGLRYNNFHTTGMCSPTRAALLTGRNAHSVGMGIVSEQATGYPGYNNLLPQSAATIARVLRDRGYNTFALGKWHNLPNQQVSVAGPFDRWPTQLGFEHFYGFQGGDANNLQPPLWLGHEPVDIAPDPNYHLTTDLANKAIRWLAQQQAAAPDKPFFLYFAPGAVHAPHQAPAAFIDRYRGKFDGGWDRFREETLARQRKLGIVPADTALGQRLQQVPAWDSLDADERRVAARMMEIYAAFTEHTDHEIGRIVDFIERLGKLDNTIIVVASDNGASAEGGRYGTYSELRFANAQPDSTALNLQWLERLGTAQAYNHYPMGWAMATNTPFSHFKQSAHYGGTSDPLIIHWPAGIQQKGGIRSQFHHAIDIRPTLLELAHIEPPGTVDGVAQQPIEGISMAYTFNDAQAKTRKTTQYFEIMGNRALWHDGWLAVAFHGLFPWDNSANRPQPDFDKDHWELYDTRADFALTRDLATREPQHLQQLEALWWQEARAHQVLPLDDRLALRMRETQQYFVSRQPPPTRYEYFQGATRTPRTLAPNVTDRSHRITAEVVLPAGAAEGMLVTNGGRFGGYAFYLQGGRLHYVHNLVGEHISRVVSAPLRLTAGAHTFVFEFTRSGPNAGNAVIRVDGREVAAAAVPKTTPHLYSIDETFDVGADTGTPVVDDYTPPFAFSGELQRLVVELL